MPPERGAARAAFLERAGVSRETAGRLDAFAALLRKWQARINLIAPSTLDSLWERHIADSWQIAALAPDARRWIDLGSGGGFPGIVVALALAPDCRVILVESNAKKCVFLRAALRELGLSGEVLGARIESVADRLEPADAVSARALAPLERLCALAYPLLKKGGTGLFPKGQDVGEELTKARQSWRIDAELVPSVTDRAARIVRVRRLEPAS